MKNFDFKKLLIDHGEKIGAAVVSLIAVFALIGTSWGRYSDSTPQEIVDTVEKTRSSMNSVTWPEEERTTFTNVEDVREQTGRLHAAIGDYECRTIFDPPLSQKREKIKPIQWVRVEDVLCDAGNMLVELNPSKIEDEDEDDAEDDDEKKDGDKKAKKKKTKPTS